MRKIFSRFDKETIGELPRAVFTGRIEVIQTVQKAEKAVKYLMQEPILGFDTETKPSFKKGQINQVSLLQVSSKKICFLFRLDQIDLPDCLIRLLSDNDILKIGLSWKDDLHGLIKRRPFTPGRFVEIQDLVGEFGIKDLSLQKLFANIFKQKISKSQRLSNWEAVPLSDSQMVYAATDAWACIVLYEELMRLKKEHYDLIVVPEPEAVSAPAEQVSKDKPQASIRGCRVKKTGYNKRKKKKNIDRKGNGQNNSSQKG